MKMLLIDTSQSIAAIALAYGEKVLASYTFTQNPETLKTLLPSIKTLLIENNWELQDLETIAVGIGPGSYTGMRVGVTVAHSLAFALKRPLVSFCSLFAFIPAEKEGTFAHICQTKRGDYYVAKGRKQKNSSISWLSQEQVSPTILDSLLSDVDFIVKNEKLPPWNPTPLLPYLAQKNPSKQVEALYFS